MLGAVNDPEKALRFLANTLTNKLIHTPTSELRRAGAEGRVDAIAQAQVLLGIEDEETPRSPPARGAKDR